MRRLLVVAVLACGFSGPVWAQAVSNTTQTTSTSSSTTLRDTTLAPININSYQTRLIGLLQGDPTLYFDQTFAFPFADSTVQSGVLAAQSALRAATPDPLSFFGPSLLSSLTTLQFSNTTTTQIGDPLLIDRLLTAERSIGPTTIIIDNRDLGGTAFFVQLGTQNVNINTHSLFQITREIQTTNNYSIFDTWQILGVRRSTSVPEPGSLALLAVGLLSVVLIRRRRLQH